MNATNTKRLDNAECTVIHAQQLLDNTHRAKMQFVHETSNMLSWIDWCALDLAKKVLPIAVPAMQDQYDLTHSNAWYYPQVREYDFRIARAKELLNAAIAHRDAIRAEINAAKRVRAKRNAANQPEINLRNES